MIRLAISTLLASTAGTLLGWAVRLTSRIAPLRPEPEPVGANEPEGVAIEPPAELRQLRHVLLELDAELDVVPIGLVFAKGMTPKGTPLTGGSRCPVN